MKIEYYLGNEKVSQQVYDTIQMYKDMLGSYEEIRQAFEIIKKYIKIYETGDDLFPYSIKENQYVSSKSCNVITKEEYDLLKEVLENDK